MKGNNNGSDRAVIKPFKGNTLGIGNGIGIGMTVSKRNNNSSTMARSERRHRRVLLGSLLALFLLAVTSNFLVSSQIVHRLGGNDDASGSSFRALKEFRMDGRSQARKLHSNLHVPVDDHPMEDSRSTPMDDNPPPSLGNETFSACLLVMDDNHRLVEWLAYHYHVLPLRYLIVAVDPRSRTSPTEILNRYRKLGMYIQEWTDHDFLDAKLANNIIPDDARLQLKRDRHRARQKVFYRTCLLHLKQANRTYVTLHDTDEYLVYNHAGGDNYPEWERKMQARHDQSRNKGKTRIKPFSTPPTTASEGSMIRYIRDEKARGYKAYETPCISIPRLHFGAVESTLQERARGAPSGLFDPDQFDTLRWRKHSKRNDFVKNNLAKVIMDVSEVDIANAPRFRSLHRPIPTICQAPWANDWETGLRFNHYLGSWESYSFRDDSRRGGERSRETWEFQAEDQDDTDDNIRPWLSGFVETHGPDKAKSLLQGVGLPKNYRNKNETAWKSAWVEDILKSNETEGTNPKNHVFDEFVRRKYQTA